MIGQEVIPAHARRGRRLAVLQQGAWSLLGQAASSLSNLLVAVLVARVASPSEFGAFALVVAVYHLALRASRSAVSTPLLMFASRDDEANTRHQVTGSVGASLLMGSILGVPLIAAGMAFAGPVGHLPILLGLLLPTLLLQDAIRYAFIATGRARWSAVCDGSWLALQLLLSYAMSSLGLATVVAYTAAWAGAGAIAAFGGLLVLRVRPRLRRGREYLAQHKRILPALLADNTVADVMVQLTPFAVAAFAGLAAAGAVRAGLVLLGVVNLVILGLTPLLQLEASSIHRGDPDRDDRVFAIGAIIVGALSFAYGVILVFLPDRAGEALLGQTWSAASTLTLPLAIYLVAQSPYPAAQISLRARQALPAAARMRLLTAPWLLALPSVGAAVDGAQGAAWGFAAAGVITGWWCLRTVRRVACEPPEPREQGEPHGSTVGFTNIKTAEPGRS